MNAEIKLLDVSLRDGGHRVNFEFAQETVTQMLQALNTAKVEYVEIGYRNGYGGKQQSLGCAGLCAREYLEFCTTIIPGDKLSVMLHPSCVTQDDLKEIAQMGIQLVRVVVSRTGLQAACEMLTLAKSCGLRVSANIIHASQYRFDALIKTVQTLSDYQPDMVYFADSNGHLKPDEVGQIFSTFTRELSIPLGFHAHDNLGLAQANAMAAIEHGAQFIDASVRGMGKGIGNLKLEYFLIYLKSLHVTKYRVQPVIELANYLLEHLGIGNEAIEIDEYVRGLHDLSTAQLKQAKAYPSYVHLLPQ